MHIVDKTVPSINSLTNLWSTTKYNEGAIGNIENLLKDKTERVASLAKVRGLSADTHYFQIGDRVKSSSSIDYEQEPELLEEWMIDLHKIKSRPLDDFFSKQKYEGIVLEVKNDSFIARLRNLTEENDDEEAEFSTADLSDDDVGLLEAGAFFYWNIGYLVLTGGQRIGCHWLNFRRLPVWSSREIQAAEDRAKTFLSWLESGDE